MLVNELYSYGRATAIPSCSASTVTEDDSGWMQQCRSTLQKLRTGFAHESCFKSCMLSANLETLPSMLIMPYEKWVEVLCKRQWVTSGQPRRNTNSRISTVEQHPRRVHNAGLQIKVCESASMPLRSPMNRPQQALAEAAALHLRLFRSTKANKICRRCLWSVLSSASVNQHTEYLSNLHARSARPCRQSLHSASRECGPQLKFGTCP